MTRRNSKRAGAKFRRNQVVVWFGRAYFFCRYGKYRSSEAYISVSRYPEDAPRCVLVLQLRRLTKREAGQ